MSQPNLLPAEWTSRAACRGCPSDKFFPLAEDPADAAKAVCRDCPVRVPCLDHALRYREAGVWGGTTERERARIRRAGPGRMVVLDSAPGLEQPRHG